MIFKYVKNGFAIAVRGKLVVIANLSPQLGVIVDHAIGHQRCTAVFIVNRLLTLGRVHDGQPGVAQYPLVNMDMHPVTIRSTVALGLDHTLYIRFVDVSPNSRNSAHKNTFSKFSTHRPR